MAPVPHDCAVILPLPVAMSVVLGHWQEMLTGFWKGGMI